MIGNIVIKALDSEHAVETTELTVSEIENKLSIPKGSLRIKGE